MRVPLYILGSGLRGVGVARYSTSASATFGRTAAYRRIDGQLHDNFRLRPWPVKSRLAYLPQYSDPSVWFSRQSLSLALRAFATSTFKSQDHRHGEEVKDPPRTGRVTPESWPKADPKAEPQDDANHKESAGGKSDQSSGFFGGSSNEGQHDHGNKEKTGNENKEKTGNEDKGNETPPPPPPHGNKTPWQVFTETLRSEFQASKEWHESTKALASSAHQFTENESVKRARAAYSAASGAATSKTSQALKGTGKILGQGAAWTWDSPVVKGVRSGVNATGRGIEKATRPVRETKIYKTTVGGVKDVIDDGSSSRYGGWIEKEERRKKREQRGLNEAGGSDGRGKRPEKLEEDPNAGTNVTVHKDAAWKESWREFKDSNRVMQSLFSLKSSYNESENPLISTARSITDRVAGFFAENETARVIKKFREMDPSFQVEPFLREMREYILPEVLDAYVKGDTDTLKLWLSTAQFQVYAALSQQYTTAGLKSDGRILDIRHVDILSARMLEPGEIPVFIITCRTQEVHVYRKVQTNELAAGMEDKVQLVTYAIGVTRVPEDVNNIDTRGWRLIELQKSARDYF